MPREYCNCEICKFIKNNDYNEKLVCSICKPGYYLNSEGKCITYVNYLKLKTNCQSYFYQINQISFCFNQRGDYSLYYYFNEYFKIGYYNSYYSLLYNAQSYCIEKNSTYIRDYSGYSYNKYSYKEYQNITKNYNLNLPIINSQIETKCIECLDGYYLNSKGSCEKMTMENCSILSILNNFPEQYLLCKYFCFYDFSNIYIEIPFVNTTNNNNETFDIYNYFNMYYYRFRENDSYIYELLQNLDDNLKLLILKSHLCFSKPENTNNFQNCERVQYDEKSNSYKCSRCYDDEYIILDSETNNCRYIDFSDNYHCDFENIGTISSPIYSCTRCDYYRDNNYLLVNTENNIKYCVKKEELEIENCTEVDANTTYIQSKYNCVNCTKNFISYHSKFYERKICQNISDLITLFKDDLPFFDKKWWD